MPPKHSAPKPLLASLRSRLQRSAQTQDAIADLFKERAAVEHAYAQGLAKALKKVENASVGQGGEKLVWEGLVNEMHEVGGVLEYELCVLKAQRRLRPPIQLWRLFFVRTLSSPCASSRPSCLRGRGSASRIRVWKRQ